MVEFIEDVLRADPSYEDIRYSDGDSFVDLSAVRAGKRVYFDTKRASTASPATVAEALAARAHLRSQDPNADLVLVVAGLLTPAATKLASESALVCWDRALLSRQAPPYVVENYLAARRRIDRPDRGSGERDRGRQLLREGCLPSARTCRPLEPLPGSPQTARATNRAEASTRLRCP